VAARGRTAQRGYRLFKATEHLLEEIGCSRDFNQECVNLLKALLEGSGCNARYIWGTYVFAASNCEVPEGFQPLEPLDFHSLTGFSTDDIGYVYYNGNSAGITGLLKYGPAQLPSESLIFNVFHFNEEIALWFRFLKATKAKSINKDIGVVNLGNKVTLYLRREPISGEKSLLERLSKDETPAVLLADRDLRRFGELKYTSLRKDEGGCFSRLQIVRGYTLQRFNKYTWLNILSALVAKSGGVPYTLEILTNNDLGKKIENLLNSGVFIGIALGRTQQGYYKAVAFVVTADLTVKLCYHTPPLPLKGPSMEMTPKEIDKFVDAIAEEIRQLVERRSVGLIVIFRTRRFKQDEGEELLNAIERKLFEGAKKLGKRPVILAIGVGKYLPLFAEGDRDLVWVVEEGEKHGILLYKFHGFKNAVRIEYHASGDLKMVKEYIAGLVLAAYEYARRLDVMSPYPLKHRILPAPVKFARRILRWSSQGGWEWSR